MKGPDFQEGGRSGLDAHGYRNGLVIGGWYDSFVGIEPRLIPWEHIDEMRRKSKRRIDWKPT